MRPRALSAAALALLALAVLAACGKKGPPLPPLEGSIPRVVDLDLRQLGEETRAYFSMPVRPEAEQVDYITTAVELWRRPAESGASAGADIDAADGVAEFTKTGEMVDRAAKEGLFDVLALERPWLSDRSPITEAGLVYEYALVLRTNLRKRGTLSNVVLLEPVPPPPRPLELLLDPQESGIVLSWTAPELPDSLLPAAEETEVSAEEPADGEEPPETPAVELAYNVYRALEDGAYAPEPLNGNPVREPGYSDPDVSEGVTYRYRVRSVLDLDGRSVLSAASEEVSFRYADLFPPATPTGLRLIAQAGTAVNLLWNPNTERDLAGYAVYRREPGGEWVRIDGGAVRSAGFVDKKLAPNRSYEYSVTAFDGASPPNESERTEIKSTTTPP